MAGHFLDGYTHIKCMTGATPDTGDLPTKVVNGYLYIKIDNIKQLHALVQRIDKNIAMRSDDTLLVIDDYYD